MWFAVRVFLCCLLLSSTLVAQQKAKEIELLHADKFTVDKYTPKGASKLKGNVQLKHQDALMFCDSALLFDNNSVKAFGHVRIIENDSLTMKGDSLFYDGKTKMAKIRSNVVIDNRTSILKTNFLDYDRNSSIGHYFGGGVIDSRQEKIHLVSKSGYYYTEPKLFHFKGDVVMTHPDYVIHTDTMHYSTDREKTWFFGPTNIDFQKRKIYCEFGWFDQLNDKARFVKKASIKSVGQILKGDTIDYDQKTQIGISKCFVVVVDSTEKIEVNGDYAVYNEKDSTSMVTTNMIMKQDMGGDTFFLVADTLFSLRDTNQKRIMKAFYNARFFKSDMQGKCDSLVYLSADSTIFLFREPILWSEDNQITADSISILLVKSEPDKMFMDQNAFIIAKEDSLLFNQIKGRNMIGYFAKSDLHKVDVHGNGQTIYYPREDDQSLIGMNETKCSDMTIRIDSSKIKRISFYDRPTALLTPSDKMPETGKLLENFNWRAADRPGSLDDLMYGTSSTPIPKVRQIVDEPLQANDSIDRIETEALIDVVPEQKAEPSQQETIIEPIAIPKEESVKPNTDIKAAKTRGGAQQKPEPKAKD